MTKMLVTLFELGGRSMAVFKVISVPQKYADEDAYADLIHYCIRPMKTPGNFIDGFGVLPQLAAEQMQIVSHAYRQDHGIRLRHWIISFEKDEIRDAWHANQFAQQVCWFTPNAIRSSTASMRMPKHSYSFVMNMISFQDGTRYTGKKKDYYDFLRYLNDIAALFGTYVYPVRISRNRNRGYCADASHIELKLRGLAYAVPAAF